MDYECITYERKGRIAHVTLNRPEKRNALSTALIGEFKDALRRADEDSEVRVVIVKGAGPAFCSGYDISGPHGDIYGRSPTIREDIDYEVLHTSGWNMAWNLHKPVIAQIHGYCIAGGTDLALSCDLVIAAEDTQIGYPPVRIHGSPPAHMWTYLVGPQWAKWVLLTGNLIDGKTAERIGLVVKAVPADKLEEEVNQLAETMAKIPTDLLIANKSIVNKALELMGRGLLQQLAAETDAIAHLTPEAEEFIRTVAEKGVKAAVEERDRPFADRH